ncbi:hypothetical protein IWC96_07610 [Brevundimonas sp. BAL450]|uniref:Uncharacterized protein n=1 Tax=Brevundimonas abyssalis TAR-001 TaxID=1391729 RepID=A0A8E0KJG6_9CAUL|nr:MULTISPECIES: hypothetical protein [Brevundimonas]MBG7615148.1 hypothetical protein [Brevundimonas sp. BAL450]GAD58234.1 hypothetical protein MBEBAB_0484 [Brevundimonas abyssalis TAR-001]
MIWMMLLAGLAAQDDPAAAAHAEADALIAAAGAEGVFENITTDTVPTLRHVQSGLTCHFTSGEATNSISVFPDAGGLSRGDNVGCNTRGQDMDVTVYATRYARDFSAAAVLDDAAAAIRHRWPEAQAYEGGFPLFTPPDREEPPLHAVFNVTVRDAPHVTFVLVQHQEEWSYKLRGTREGDDVMIAGMTGSMMFMNALGDIGGEP